MARKGAKLCERTLGSGGRSASIAWVREQCLRPLWTSPEGHKTKRLSFLREHPAIGGGALRTRATCERVCFGFDANLCRITSGSKFVSNVVVRMIPSNPAITTERLFLRRKCPLPHTFRLKFAANRLQIPQKRCKRLRKCYKMLRIALSYKNTVI